MSTAERRQEEKEQRRQEIIEAAEKVFARRGVDKATMADVADESRLSRGLIYFYFKDKEALYLAVIFRATKALYERFVEAVSDGESGLEKIKSLGKAYVDFHHSSPNYFDALSDFESRTVNLDAPHQGEMECLLEGSKVLRLMESVIEEGIQDGSIRSDLGDPMSAAVALWGFTHGVIQITANKASMLNHLFGLDMDHLMEQAFEMMDRSLSG